MLAGGLATGASGVAGASPPKPARPAPNTVAAAARRTETAGSDHVTMQVTVTGAGSAARSVTVSAVGVVDNGPPVSSAATDLHLHLAGYGTAELRLVDGVVYARLPASLQHRLPATLRGWLALDLNAVTKARFGETLSQLVAAAPMSSSTLAALRRASTTVTDAGPKTIRKVPTTEYVARVDLAKIAGRDPALSAAQARRLRAALGSSTLPVEVWIDHQGRIRQVHLRTTVANGALAGAAGTAGTGSSPGTASGSSTISFTMDQFDFGPHVPVAAPPASRVHNLTSQVIAASGSASGGASGGTSGGTSGG